jgi:hypothetical protein
MGIGILCAGYIGFPIPQQYVHHRLWEPNCMARDEGKQDMREAVDRRNIETVKQ